MPPLRQCGFYISESACNAASSSCSWFDGLCQHNAGWTASQIGLFGALNGIGGFIFTPFTGPLTTYFGGNRLHTIFFSSVVALVLAVASHLSFGVVAGAADSNSEGAIAAVLAVRTFLGAPPSLLAVAINLLLGERLSKDLRRLGGSLFNASCGVFLLIMAVLGFAVEKTIDYSVDDGLQVSRRLQIIIGVNTLVSLLLVIVSGMLIQFERARSDASSVGQLQKQQVSESDPLILQNREEPSLNGEHEEGQEEEEAPTDEFPTCSQILAVIFVPFAVFGGGINAQIVYSGYVGAALGIDPLLTNVVTNVANTLMSLVAIFFLGRRSVRVSFRRTFLIGIVGCCMANLVAAFGFSFAPTESARDLVFFLGSCLFFGFFNLAIAPCYYPLCSRAVSAGKYRDHGTAGSLVFEGLLNFSLNFGFPVFVSAFPNRIEGQAFAFFFFAFNLFVSLGILWKVLKKSRDYG